MKKLSIIGSNALARQIIHHCKFNNEIEVIGVFDDFKKIGEVVEGNIKVIGTTDDIFAYFAKGIFHQLMIGIGYHQMESRINQFNRFSEKIEFVIKIFFLQPSPAFLHVS